MEEYFIRDNVEKAIEWEICEIFFVFPILVLLFGHFSHLPIISYTYNLF